MQVELCPEKYQLGDAKVTPENKAPSKLDVAIKKIIENEGYITYKVNKNCLSTKGGNYLGVLYAIDVKGKTKDEEKETNIFVKEAMDEEEALKIVSVADVYKTENFAYKELGKIFEELQEEVNVPIEERYKMVKVYNESYDDAIIMENVTYKGFITYHRTELMSLKFLEMSVKHLARFHALSFVLEKRKPDYFNEKIKTLKYPIIFKEEWNILVKTMKDLSVNNIDEEYKDRLEKVFESVGERFEHNVTDESIQVCLCHGDYRPNNIMTKIEEGEIIEIIPIDYQLIHYGCPIFDFLYLIYYSTDREFRKAHMKDLKDLYYGTLKTFLLYFNIDVNDVYPEEVFERVYKERLDQGLMFVLMYLPFMLAVEDGTPDVSQEIEDMCIRVDERYRDRLRGVIEDYVEWGFI
ncbi:uncharacterized protein LOC142978538 [Anticarsia gemmatalis]|uniref:uncharacterized protein LOC142978538 n=1 Tax=Anticarsia gemmatalis TaxID=129554 RepID=UPI003F770976